MEALEGVLILCLAITVGAIGGIAGGCKIHLLRVKEAMRLINGQVDRAEAYKWADWLWLRLFLLVAGVVLVIFGWQYLFCDGLSLFLLVLVGTYWATRARRAYNNIVDFS